MTHEFGVSRCKAVIAHEVERPEAMKDDSVNAADIFDAGHLGRTDAANVTLQRLSNRADMRGDSRFANELRGVFRGRLVLDDGLKVC